MREWNEIAPVVRGALASASGDPDRPWRRLVLEHRSSDEILHFAAAEQGPALAASAPITPDHVIRTKGPYLFVERPPYANYRSAAREAGRGRRRVPPALRGVLRALRGGEASHSRRCSIRRRACSCCPGSAWWPRARRAPRRASPRTSPSTPCARRSGRRRSASTRGSSESELFDIEYWSLEQAKLGKGKSLAARRAGRAGHGRRGGDRRGRRARARARGRAGAAGRPRRGAARGDARARSVRRSARSSAPTCPTRATCATRSATLPSCSAAWTSWS